MDEKTLNVVNIYSSIQKIGDNIGTPCLYIDIENEPSELSDKFGYIESVKDYLLNSVYDKKINDGTLVIITGDDPFRKPEELAQFVHNFRTTFGFKSRLEIETTGAYEIPPEFNNMVQKSLIDRIVVTPIVKYFKDSQRENTKAFQTISHLSHRDRASIIFQIRDHNDFENAKKYFIDRFNLKQKSIYLVPAVSYDDKTVHRDLALKVANIAIENDMKFSINIFKALF